MSLITEVTNKAFDLETIKKGFLIYAKHKSWAEGRSGFVTNISEQEITVQYLSKVGTITNHYVIPVKQADEGSWEIRWSEALITISELEVRDDQ